MYIHNRRDAAQFPRYKYHTKYEEPQNEVCQIFVCVVATTPQGLVEAKTHNTSSNTCKHRLSVLAHMTYNWTLVHVLAALHIIIMFIIQC